MKNGLIDDRLKGITENGLYGALNNAMGQVLYGYAFCMPNEIFQGHSFCFDTQIYYARCSE
jgi:hypothetical protein